MVFLKVIGLSFFLTAASFVVDMGCSCGPEHGFPLSYVHPNGGCTPGRFVLGSDERRELEQVLDLGALSCDLVIWGAIGGLIILVRRALDDASAV